MILYADERSLSHAKLCVITLTCVVEVRTISDGSQPCKGDLYSLQDQHACVFLHDSNISFEVALHKAVSSPPQTTPPPLLLPPFIADDASQASEEG